MPFIYDVCNVKQQLYAKGLVWSLGEGCEALQKNFYYFLYVELQKQNFQPVFFNRYLSNEKCPFADKSRTEPIIVSMGKSFFFETFIWPFV